MHTDDVIFLFSHWLILVEVAGPLIVLHCTDEALLGQKKSPLQLPFWHHPLEVSCTKNFSLFQDLDSPDRNLVKEGQVFLKNVKKLYQCILFNDLLVFAHGDSRQSIVELQLSLEAVWVEDLEDLDPQTSELYEVISFSVIKWYWVVLYTSLCSWDPRYI